MLRTIAAEEICGGRALLAFQSNLLEFERGVVAAADEETIVCEVEFGGSDGFEGGSRLDDLQTFAAEFCMRAGPRLEAADAIEDFFGGA
jgi:hypothetical protein